MKKLFFVIYLLIFFLLTSLAQAESIIDKITLSVKNFETSVPRVGHFEITVWDMKANLLTEDTKPPYEVIVNGVSNNIDCFDAKYSLYEIMKRIYTDAALQNKIARIKVTIPYQLRASLGSKDATFDWDSNGPSNFWQVLLEYKPYENESGPLNERTYGVKINQSCYK